MLSTPRTGMSHNPNQGAKPAKQSPEHREHLIRAAIKKGVPLSQIEAWLDWMELVEQAAQQQVAAGLGPQAGVLPPNALPDSGP